jgi:hypothetical protein
MSLPHRFAFKARKGMRALSRSGRGHFLFGNSMNALDSSPYILARALKIVDKIDNTVLTLVFVLQRIEMHFMPGRRPVATSIDKTDV